MGNRRGEEGERVVICWQKEKMRFSAGVWSVLCVSHRVKQFLHSCFLVKLGHVSRRWKRNLMKTAESRCVLCSSSQMDCLIHAWVWFVPPARRQSRCMLHCRRCFT